ncbi:Uncharacterised protein [Mycobacteroides abscessus subsp. massiliense]|nr:Uncharacterised protein [Mycobacteroides abscessus subsp. massiliense]
MRLLTHTAIGLGLALTPFASPIAAHAIPLTCEHRGVDHVERHGGTVKDREYHLARGERVSCEPEDKHPHPSVTPTAPTTYVPVPVQTEEDEDDDDHHHWHRKNKWWRDD